MTEMESPLEDYADGLGFHFDGYFIWRLLYLRVGDALRFEKIDLYKKKKTTFSRSFNITYSVLIFFFFHMCKPFINLNITF